MRTLLKSFEPSPGVLKMSGPLPFPRTASIAFQEAVLPQEARRLRFEAPSNGLGSSANTSSAGTSLALAAGLDFAVAISYLSGALLRQRFTAWAP